MQKSLPLAVVAMVGCAGIGGACTSPDAHPPEPSRKVVDAPEVAIAAATKSSPVVTAGSWGPTNIDLTAVAQQISGVWWEDGADVLWSFSREEGRSIDASSDDVGVAELTSPCSIRVTTKTGYFPIQFAWTGSEMLCGHGQLIGTQIGESVVVCGSNAAYVLAKGHCHYGAYDNDRKTWTWSDLGFDECHLEGATATFQGDEYTVRPDGPLTPDGFKNTTLTRMASLAAGEAKLQQK